MRRYPFSAFALALILISGCVTAEKEAPPLSAGEVAFLLPKDLKDRMGWATDIIAAIERADRVPTPERVCATIAVIEQESGFEADPVVRDLPRIVREGLEQKFEKLGPLKGVAVEAVLRARAPGTKENFGARVAKLKTESDLDRLYRDIQSSLRDRFPGPVVVASTISKLMGNGWLEDLNPVTTAGPMQVKVSFAKELPEFNGLSDAEARDLLYTRRGGIYAGAARLLGYEANYDDVIYRFADYNAGVYSSRNAAFQKILSDLTGQKLATDGDLLSYDREGDPKGEETASVKAMLAFAKSHDISESAVRRAANHEKTIDLEDYDVYDAARNAWQVKHKKAPPYAVIPAVTLRSPKLSGNRSTEWFAKNVKRRYDACRRK